MSLLFLVIRVSLFFRLPLRIMYMYKYQENKKKRKNSPTQTNLKSSSQRPSIHSSNHRFLPHASTHTHKPRRRMHQQHSPLPVPIPIPLILPPPPNLLLLNQILPSTKRLLSRSRNHCDAQNRRVVEPGQNCVGFPVCGGGKAVHLLRAVDGDEEDAGGGVAEDVGG